MVTSRQGLLGPLETVLLVIKRSNKVDQPYPAKVTVRSRSSLSTTVLHIHHDKRFRLHPMGRAARLDRDQRDRLSLSFLTEPFYLKKCRLIGLRPLLRLTD
jgi:predicted ferric reductase